MKYRYYLAGPMRGHAEFNFPAFFQADHYLATYLGVPPEAIFNPARRDVDNGFDWKGLQGTDQELKDANFDVHAALRADFEAILESDCVLLLPGWSQSQGACIERAVAMQSGIEVRYYDPQGGRGWKLCPAPLVSDKYVAWGPWPPKRNYQSTQPTKLVDMVPELRAAQRHPSSQRLHDLLAKMGELHDRKQADYGSATDPFANVRASEDFGIPAWVGALVRMNDKMQRLKAAAKGSTLKNEGVEDSFMDLAVYALIGLVLHEEAQS